MSGYVIFRAEDVPGQAEPVEGAKVITVDDALALTTALGMTGNGVALPAVREAILRFVEDRPEEPTAMGSTAVAHCRCSYPRNRDRPLFMLAPGGKWIAECGAHDWVTLFNFVEVTAR